MGSPTLSVCLSGHWSDWCHMVIVSTALSPQCTSHHEAQLDNVIDFGDLCHGDAAKAVHQVRTMMMVTAVIQLENLTWMWDNFHSKEEKDQFSILIKEMRVLLEQFRS